jgi:hypothetical protein
MEKGVTEETHLRYNGQGMNRVVKGPFWRNGG